MFKANMSSLPNKRIKANKKKKKKKKVTDDNAS